MDKIRRINVDLFFTHAHNNHIMNDEHIWRPTVHMQKKSYVRDSMQIKCMQQKKTKRRRIKWNVSQKSDLNIECALPLCLFAQLTTGAAENSWRVENCGAVHYFIKIKSVIPEYI